MAELFGFNRLNLVLQRFRQNIGQADKGHQRCLEFMAQNPEQAILHFAGSPGFGLGAPQVPFNLAVADDELRVIAELRPVDGLGNKGRGPKAVSFFDRGAVVIAR